MMHFQSPHIFFQAFDHEWLCSIWGVLPVIPMGHTSGAQVCVLTL